MRPLIGLLTVAALAAVSLPAQASGVALQDIQNHWARPQIQAGVAAGYIAGYPDGSFRPDASVTRAEFFKMLGAAMRLSPSQVVTGFAEESAPSKHWAFAQGYVPAAVSAGLLHPPDYGPALQGDLPITRREIVMASVRALGMGALTDENRPLTTPDADAYDPWLRNYAAIALAEGIITGYEDRSIGLGRSATRAEALVMVQRILGKVTLGVLPSEDPKGAVRHPGEGEPFWSWEQTGSQTNPVLIRSLNGSTELAPFPGAAAQIRLLPAPGKAVWVRYSLAGEGVIARFAAGKWTEVARYPGGGMPEPLAVDDEGRLWFAHGGTGLLAADRGGKVWTVSGSTEPIRFGAIDWEGLFWGLSAANQIYRVSAEGGLSVIAADLPAGIAVDHFALGEDGTVWLITRPAGEGGVKAEALQLREGRTVRRVPLLGRYYGGLDAQASIRVVGQSGPFFWISGVTGGREDGLYRLDLKTGAFPRLVLPPPVGAGQAAQPAPGGGALVRDVSGRFWRVMGLFN